MSLQEQVMDAMKVAMKAKDSRTLEALRAVKAALLLAQTEGGSKTELSEEEEMKLLQKLVKQRRDSEAIYMEQGREDLAAPEREQALVIEQFLPEKLGEEEVLKTVNTIIAETGASSMKEMGMVMGMANKQLAGKADGKMIAAIVKERLS